MLKISVSGVRGEYPKELTREVVKRFSYAFARMAGGGTVLVGRDTRPSGLKLRHSVFEGLALGGARATDIGIVPTPTALFAVRKKRASGAVVITASHNPNPWNGLKFISRRGLFLDRTDADRLFRLYSATALVPRPTSRILRNRRPSVRKWSRAVDEHIRKIRSLIDVRGIRKARLCVAADMGNGAGAVATPQLLEGLGCTVVPLMDKPNGRFRPDPEPTAKNLEALCRKVRIARADVGFAQDPDADRLAIVSERARPIGEENTLTLALSNVLARRRGPVVVNVSTSSMCEAVCRRYRSRLYRSRIGEANVAQLMQRVGALVGGEGNGGVIYPLINFGRDSLVAMGLILDLMAREGVSVEALVSRIPQTHMVKVKIPLLKDKLWDVLGEIRSRYKRYKMDLTDGVKIYIGNGWVHCRASNTEPVVRIISEAPTLREARRLVTRFRKELTGR